MVFVEWIWSSDLCWDIRHITQLRFFFEIKCFTQQGVTLKKCAIVAKALQALNTMVGWTTIRRMSGCHFSFVMIWWRDA